MSAWKKPSRSAWRRNACISFCGQFRQVVAGGAKRIEIGELDAVDPFEGQHVARGQLPLDFRHPEALVAGGRLGHFRERGCLEPEVHLDRHRPGEGVDHRHRPEPARGRIDPLDDAGAGIESVEVAPETLPMPGRSTLTATCLRPVLGDDPGLVDLRDRRRGDRRGERREQHVDRLAERLLDRRPRLRLGKRLDLVVQPAERVGDLGADDVGPGREELAELDVGGAEPVDGAGQAFGLAVDLLALDQPRQPERQARPPRQGFGVDAGEGAFAGEDETGARQAKQRGDGARHRSQSFQPEWMAAIPPERLSTSTRSKPAASIIAAKRAWFGNLRIDSTR